MRNSLARVAVTDDTIDLDIAQRFVDLLGAKQISFQTFDDNAKRKAPNLVCILHGSLAEHADQLAHLNRLGAGIFVSVNQTDGEGRKRENIKRVRAVTLDLDGAALEPICKADLKPHVIVESSPGRYHVYWRVGRFPLDEFEGVLRAIAKRFDGDPAIAKLTHVARLPGFHHRKGEPFRTRIVEVNDLPPYTAEQILAEFPPETKPHKPPVSLAGRLVLPGDDPLTCAEEFVRQNYQTDGIVCLQYYRGSFYRWIGTHYAEIDVKEVRSKLYEFLKSAIRNSHGTFVPFRPTRTKVNAILDALEAGVYQARDKRVPFWIEPFQHASALDLVACQNGLLNLETRKLLPHDPHLFNINSLPFDYDADAPTYPKSWQAFLRQLWPNDEDHKLSRLTLQEIFGLMLTPDTRHQKIFMIVGPKRSGKGTIARVLTAMLGKDNVAHPTLASLSTNFGLSPLIDKRAAIISDARLGPQTNSHTVAERLLSISGEDAITVDRKYRDPWTGRFDVRFLILTNELPRFTDASGALASRFVVLTLDNSFYGKEDLELTDRLLTELPGILNWSLFGLERLKKRGHFRIPKSSLQATRQLEDLASPVGAFLRDWCSVGPNEREDIKTMFDAWWHWCDQHGHRAGSAHVFGRNLHAILPSVIARGRGVDRFYQGVALSKEGNEQYEAANRMAGRRQSNS